MDNKNLLAIPIIRWVVVLEAWSITTGSNRVTINILQNASWNRVLTLKVTGKQTMEFLTPHSLNPNCNLPNMNQVSGVSLQWPKAARSSSHRPPATWTLLLCLIRQFLTLTISTTTNYHLHSCPYPLINYPLLNSNHYQIITIIVISAWCLPPLPSHQIVYYINSSHQEKAKQQAIPCLKWLRK